MNNILQGIGTIQIWYSIIIGVIITIILFCVGSMFIQSDELVRYEAVAQIISKECSEFSNKNIRECKLKIKFKTQKGEEIVTDIFTQLNRDNFLLDKEKVLYIPQDPTNVYLLKDKPISKFTMGVISILCGIVSGGFSYINYKFRQNESFKTYSGAVGTANIVSSIFSSNK